MGEFVAELGAAFLCADLGVTNGSPRDHTAHIAHWLQLFKNDTKAVFTAASKVSERPGHQAGLDRSGSAKVEEQPSGEAEDNRTRPS